MRVSGRQTTIDRYMSFWPSGDSFWSSVDIRNDDECWEWKGKCQPFGYGQVYIPRTWMLHGDRHYYMSTEKSHRVAYELANGPVPRGMSVLHTCDNPSCCNPKHLWLGTQGDNMRDKVAKGRGRNSIMKAPIT